MSYPETSTIFPYFKINPDNIEFIYEPCEYYSQLKHMFANAKDRIIISSLYLGTGRLEKDLVSTIEQNLKKNNNLTVKTLFDYSRGLRNKENSKTIFQKCIENYPERFKLFLYHTPKLRGLLKKLLPERVDEVIGVMHIKAYIADNDLIITGANLSNDYFVDRQDRYLILKDCKHLCDFYSDLFDQIKDLSFGVNKNGQVTFNNKNQSFNPYQGNYFDFCQEFSERIHELYRSYRREQNSFDLNKINFENDDLGQNTSRAYLIPLVQNGLAGVKYDEVFTNYIISNSPARSDLSLATGYFNLTPNLMDRILNSQAPIQVLTTSELGNGFYGSKGFSKYIPHIYTCIEKEFYDLIMKSNQQNRVKLFEYYKENWTFHAKGLWYVPNKSNEILPSMTLIGSSNFGHRSVGRDLEFQLAIYSQNEKFKKKLFAERTHVYEHSKLINSRIPVNKINRFIRVISKLVKNYF